MSENEPFGVNELIGLWTRAGFTQSEMIDLLARYLAAVQATFLFTEGNYTLWVKTEAMSFMDETRTWPTRR